MSITLQHLATNRPYGIEEFKDTVCKSPILSERTKLTKVIHYKENSGCQHEFLVAYIQNVAHGRHLRKCLRIERNRVAGPTFTSISSTFPADDMVTVFEEGYTSQSLKDHYTIASYVFVEHPALLEFCIILSHVIGNKRDYQLRDAQCYWFCLATVNLICKELDGKEERGADYDRAGHWFKVEVHTRAAVDKGQTEYRNQLLTPSVVGAGRVDKEESRKMVVQREGRSAKDEPKKETLREADIRAREDAKAKLTALNATPKGRHETKHEGGVGGLWATIERVRKAEESRAAKEVEEQTRWMEPTRMAELANGWNDYRGYAPAGRKLTNLWMDRGGSD
ncbi:hypothetical protein BOTBODRAFT_34784 [Botryobasidium botryosum FD-172 SS1]|uniref:Uncharacterized protein n=1 Tax=Botryobasidium botryosum (strain FD-172 SS1) TaxID=930990 RepID=A0A067M8S4_BOTB1|nr:hypothetical protein BOTBODRAFT_34784 [Botryobasidium botryosum FD-172 SS1]